MNPRGSRASSASTDQSGYRSSGQFTEDEDDGDQIRRRMSSGFHKSKSKAFGKRRRLDAKQYTMCIGSCFLILWGLSVTVLLLQMGIMYTFDTIIMTRKEYAVNGAAEWAKAKASRDVHQAVDVWNIINASVNGLVYKSPQDYSNLAAVLSPAFDVMPSLHSVEFAYSDRTAQVVVTRSKKENGAEVNYFHGWESSSHMQSNSADCFLMGVTGCVGTDSESIINPLKLPEKMKRPPWYETALGLKTVGLFGDAFAWQPEQDLVVESTPQDGDLISPSIRLLFRVTFPMHQIDGKSTVATGRITVKVAALGGDRLVDNRLGDDGAIYVCDTNGVLLSSRDRLDVLRVEDGIVQSTKIWDDGRSWSSGIREAFKGNSIEAMQTDGGTLVVVEPLESPLDRFAVVVVAPSLIPFGHVVLIGTSALASIVAPAPYAITATIATIFFCFQCFRTMVKNDGKVGYNSTSKRNARVSISATMAKHGSPGFPGFGKDKRSPSEIMREGKLQRLMSFMGRKSGIMR